MNYPLARIEEIDQIIKGAHPDPHSVLGNHQVQVDGKDAIVIRAFVPKAKTASVIIAAEGGAKLPMTKIHADGLFEVIVREHSDFFPYTLEVTTDHEVRLRRSLPLSSHGE